MPIWLRAAASEIYHLRFASKLLLFDALVLPSSSVLRSAISLFSYTGRLLPHNGLAGPPKAARTPESRRRERIKRPVARRGNI